MFRTLILLVTVAISLSSCKESKPENQIQENQPVDTVAVSTVEKNESETLQYQLQGTWKRVDYPYSRYEFKENTAKLVSEGQAEEPQFNPYTLTIDCPYGDVTVDVRDGELILGNARFESCETVRIENDTLKIGGVDREYVIQYVKK